MALDPNSYVAPASEAMLAAKLVQRPSWRRFIDGFWIIFGGIVAGLLFGTVGLGQIGAWVIIGFFVLGAVQILWDSPRTRFLECPYCKQTTKQGATVCPHCSREFSTPS